MVEQLYHTPDIYRIYVPLPDNRQQKRQKTATGLSAILLIYFFIHSVFLMTIFVNTLRIMHEHVLSSLYTAE